MNVLSLFDGISCGRVALERLGLRVDVYDAYEIDKYAIQVSSNNYPSISHNGDVFQAKYQEGKYDLLIGGSPCTYWSIANKNREKNASGNGWILFLEYVRALREAKPTYFLFENNANISPEIIQKINEMLGCKPIRINSSDFSAQNRDRLYWTNIPLRKRPPKNTDTIHDILYDKEDELKIKNFDKYADTIKTTRDGNRVTWDSSGHGKRYQQNRAIVNGKMVTIPARGTDKCNIYLGGSQYRPIHPVEAERLQNLPDNYTQGLSTTQRFHAIGNGWTVGVIEYLLSGLLDTELGRENMQEGFSLIKTIVAENLQRLFKNRFYV